MSVEYVPPPFICNRVCKLAIRESRPLNVPIKVISLPDEIQWIEQLMDFTNTMASTLAIDKIARACGAPGVSQILASEKPRSNLSDPGLYALNGDETLCVALKGNGWEVPDDVIDKMVAMLKLDKSVVQMRYPAHEYLN